MCVCLCTQLYNTCGIHECLCEPVLSSTLVCRSARWPAARDVPPGDGRAVSCSLGAGGPLPQVQSGPQHPTVPTRSLHLLYQPTPAHECCPHPNPLPCQAPLPPPPPSSPPPPVQGAWDVGSLGPLCPPGAQWSAAPRSGLCVPRGGRGGPTLPAGSLHVQSRGRHADGHGRSPTAPVAGRRDFHLTRLASKHFLWMYCCGCRRLVFSSSCLFKYRYWLLITVFLPVPSTPQAPFLCGCQGHTIIVSSRAILLFNEVQLLMTVRIFWTFLFYFYGWQAS